LKLVLLAAVTLLNKPKQLGEDVLQRFAYSFSENGLVAYRDGQLIHKQSLVTYLGEEHFATFDQRDIDLRWQFANSEKTWTFCRIS